MQVFLSWSKPKSKSFAERLREWLPEIIQEIEPWMSTEDIPKGQRWAAEIGEKLGAISQGILCVTAENAAEPWLNFEAGALAKSLETANVRPLLFDLRPSDVTGPMALFQATVATDQDDMYRFVASLNSVCLKPLDPTRLRRAFDREWPALDEDVRQILASRNTNVEAEPRADGDVIAEILDRVREIQRDSNVQNGTYVNYAFAQELSERMASLGLSLSDLSAVVRLPRYKLLEILRGREPTIRESTALDRYFGANGELLGLASSGPLGRGLGRLIPGTPWSQIDEQDEEASR